MTDPTAGTRRGLPRHLPLAVVLATLVTRLPGLVSSRAFNTDEATLAILGRTISGDGTLYLSATDHKPPLAFAWYGMVQAVTGSTDLRFVRASVVLLVVATALVLAVEAQRRWGAEAAWVAGLVTVATAAALGPADAQAANFELFALLPIAVAVVAAARGRFLVAGVALAVAVSCKQPAALTAVPVAWSAWRLRRARGVATVGVAGAVSLLALWLPFGLDRVVEWALLRNDGYLAVSSADLRHAFVRLSASVGLLAGLWFGAWVLVLAGAWSRRRDGADRAVTDVTGATDAWLLLGVSAVAVVPGFRFFPHYLLQLVPAVALLAAFGASRRPRLVVPALGATALCSTIALALAWYQVSLPVPPPEVAVARYVADHTEPGDRVLVWGNLPEVYWRADRLPAGGLTHNNLLTGYSGRRPVRTTEADVADPELYRELLEQIRADDPVLVVDVAASGVRGGDRYPLAGYGELARFVAERYERVATVEGAVVYRRLEAAP